MIFNKEHTYRLVLMSSDMDLVGDYEANFCSKKHVLDWSKYQTDAKGMRLGVIYITDTATREAKVYTASGKDWVRERIKAMEKKDNTAAVAIGNRLQAIRLEKGLTIDDICRRSGLKPSTVQALEAGAYNSGIRELTKLAAALDVSIVIR